MSIREFRMKKTKSDTASVVASPPVVMFAFLGAGLLVHLAYPLRIAGPDQVFCRLIALAPLLASGVLALSASLTLRKKKTPVNPGKPTTAIVTGGPYRYTRNPLYLSLLLLYIGISVLVGSLWPFLFLPLLFAVFHYGMVLREERYLEGKFSAEYLDYRSRVRRWI